MQRLTLTLVFTSVSIVGAAALFSSAIQSAHTPLVAELKPPVTEPDSPFTPVQAPNHSPLAPELKGPGPVNPGNIVVIHGRELLSAGGGLVVYNVPGERWLVLTDIEAAWSTSGRAVLTERMGSLSTDVRSNFLSTGFHSVTGLVFQPGSQVLLREASLANSVDVSYSFSGYLVEP